MIFLSSKAYLQTIRTNVYRKGRPHKNAEHLERRTKQLVQFVDLVLLEVSVMFVLKCKVYIKCIKAM